MPIYPDSGVAEVRTVAFEGDSMATAVPQIPYGWADFEAMRVERCLYVDKTRFLRELERERYAFLIRPRRFGKSCWISLLQNYYDRSRADRFETLFAGTDAGRRPTPNRHRYVILRFDFSIIDDTPRPCASTSSTTASSSSATRRSATPTCFPKRPCGASWLRPPSTPN